MNIVTYPAEVLREKATPIEEINDEVCRIAEEMLELMYEAEGIGLAAPQIGWSKKLIVLDVKDELGEEKVFINPTLVNQDGTFLSDEGCLSFPDVTGMVMRSDSVEVVAFNLKGEKLKIKAGGLLGVVFQHEIDHLNGVLFIDKMTPGSSFANAKKLKKFERIHKKVQAL